MRKVTHSPWGKIDVRKNISDDIIEVSTPSHGGFGVTGKAKQNILNMFPSVGEHVDVNNEMSWFEEDCDYAFVILANKECFQEKDIQAAESSMKSWYPEAWREYSGDLPDIKESIMLRKKLFEEQHMNDNVVISALGLTDGMVLCIAKVGGRNGDGEESAWFVEKEKYDQRGQFDYVISESDIAAPGSADKCWAAFYRSDKRTMQDIIQAVEADAEAEESVSPSM